ncbi:MULTISPECIES: hypothetical protein [unclassified Rathayibacter]|uniref:hypothetical protein n=1 Tax=unclassified Rathayibacter TaxID=2609250 RepID=UPI000A69DED4|nr:MULTISPECIES: hypothetical protein [unclassified Rathayibacter]
MDGFWDFVKNVFGLQPGEFADWLSGIGTILAVVVAYRVWRGDVRAKARIAPDSFNLTMVFHPQDDTTTNAIVTWVNGPITPILLPTLALRTEKGELRTELISHSAMPLTTPMIDPNTTNEVIFEDVGNKYTRAAIRFVDINGKVWHKKSDGSAFVEATAVEYDSIVHDGTIVPVDTKALSRFRAWYKSQKYTPWRWVK